MKWVDPSTLSYPVLLHIVWSIISIFFTVYHYKCVVFHRLVVSNWSQPIHHCADAHYYVIHEVLIRWRVQTEISLSLILIIGTVTASLFTICNAKSNLLQRLAFSYLLKCLKSNFITWDINTFCIVIW